MVIKILSIFLLILFIIKFNIIENFINLSNITWVNIKASSCKQIFIYKDKIYKKCPITSNYYKILSMSFDFIPKAKYDKKFSLTIEDYFKHNLTKDNKPKDYINQLNKIESTLKKNNIYHNDIKMRHFFVKNNKIKLIDWDNSSFNKPLKRKWVNNDFNLIKDNLL